MAKSARNAATSSKTKLLLGDNIASMRKLPDNSIDAIVTDPPYGLSFMGKSWDYDVPSVDMWKEAFRILKPGGHVLSFSGTRTYHMMVIRMENAGFEIRDMLSWLYGSGFPKSHNVSKGIDAWLGVDREVESTRPLQGTARPNKGTKGSHGAAKTRGANDGYVPTEGAMYEITKPASPASLKWDGWGTALKPACEPICLAMKPLSESSVAENVLKWGTGSININGSKIGDERRTNTSASAIFGSVMQRGPSSETIGRWPANVLLDEQAGEMLGESKRFFYVAKASKGERNAGCEDLDVGIVNKSCPPGSAGSNSPRAGAGRTGLTQNIHPTVKPAKLMEYLIRLITPPGGIVLDPFMGSGTTGIAAKRLGFNFVGCEIDPQYMTIAEKRIAAVKPA